jgi:hypothetical protein
LRFSAVYRVGGSKSLQFFTPATGGGSRAKNRSFKRCYGIYSDLSPLKLRNNITLESLKDGWKVKFPEDYVSRNGKQEFNNLIAIANSKNEYWLKETDDKDRIEIAVEFIKALA